MHIRWIRTLFSEKCFSALCVTVYTLIYPISNSSNEISNYTRLRFLAKQYTLIDLKFHFYAAVSIMAEVFPSLIWLRFGGNVSNSKRLCKCLTRIRLLTFSSSSKHHSSLRVKHPILDVASMLLASF